MADTKLSDPVAAVAGNRGVEYVISFRFNGSEKADAEAVFERLIKALDRVGLRTEVRDGMNGNVLVFVRVRSEQKLIVEVYRSRVKDWLHGVTVAAPDKDIQKSLGKKPLTEAERLRIVWQLITSPASEGGAGITQKQGEWKLVENIFPLHNHEFNKAWMKKWSTTWFIGPKELDELRDYYGEKVTFYFAFLRSYLTFSLIAATLGVSAFFLLPSYSLIYAVANCLWSVIFVEYWKRQEVDLAVRWGVRNVSSLQRRRAQFVYEAEVQDPVTGEVVKFFPTWKRLARQSLQIPFALGASALLSALYAAVFAIEIFLGEVYNGPFKNLLVFLPTALLGMLVPVFTSILTVIATKLTDFENYENESCYEAAITQKVFVFDFICSYVPLFLTAFIYVPFGNRILPHLDVFNLTTQTLSTSNEEILDTPLVFQVNPDRLKEQIIYLTITAQIISIALETIVPFLKRKLFRKAKEFQNKRNGITAADDADEHAFLRRVRNEAELDLYDVQDDHREMCVQFGYLSLFSPGWPLAAIPFSVANWVELRSDAAKICVEMQRPVPHRADSIGSWLGNLGFLSWIGSISSTALICLFSNLPNGTPDSFALGSILAAILFSEHVYFATSYVVRMAMTKLESPGLLQEQHERFEVRRRLLQESLGVDEETDISVHENYEHGASEERRFWGTRRGSEGAVSAGREIIRKSFDKKDQ